MRRLLSAIIILAIAIPTIWSSAQHADRMHVHELMGDFIKAYNDHDIDAAMSLVHTSAVMKNPCETGMCRTEGRIDIRHLLEEEWTAFPDSVLEVYDQICESDRCMIAYTFSGTHSSKYRSFRPYGKRLNQIPVHGWFRFLNGTIIESQLVFDYHAVMDKLSANTLTDQLQQKSWEIGEIWSGKRNVETLRHLLSKHYRGHGPWSPGESRDTAIDEVRSWRHAFPDLKSTWRFGSNGGDRPYEIIVMWHMNGTFQNDWGDYKANNQSVSMCGITVSQYDHDGLIAESETYFDSAKFAKEMGGDDDRTMTSPITTLERVMFAAIGSK